MQQHFILVTLLYIITFTNAILPQRVFVHGAVIELLNVVARERGIAGQRGLLRLNITLVPRPIRHVLYYYKYIKNPTNFKKEGKETR